MSGAPISLIFYDKETNEPVKTYTRTFIPWKLMKRVAKLMKVFGKGFAVEDMNEEAVDEITGLIVDIFGGQFTVQELEDCSDFDEMVVVLNQVMHKITGSINENPTGQA